MRTLTLLVAAIAACVATATAAADGLPVLGIDVGSVGVAVPGGSDRYVTIDEGEWTLVERIARDGGRVKGLTRVRGTFTIPAVAYDGSANGLSADGKTLVLIEPRKSFPRQVTRFAVLAAPGLGLSGTITLRGDFSFDAVSPRGRTMYLVNYTQSGDPNRYSVRAYDLNARRLLPKPVTDPAEHSDRMRGAPITRLMSLDGRWAYTLYDGAGTTPFVHALDTTTRSAHCIDLEMARGRRDLWTLRLSRGADDGRISLVSAATPVAVIDTTTFAASVPTTRGTQDLRSWLLAGGAVLAAILLAVAVPAGRRLRGRLATV